MKIRYIYHSCFYRNRKFLLIFDYFKHRSDNRDFDFEKLLKDAFISPKPFMYSVPTPTRITSITIY